MASGTLYSYPESFRANKILIAAAYSGANVTVDPNFEYGKTNTSADFLKKFPLGKVPAFESNGTYFNESNAIAQYVSNEDLLGGANAADKADVTEYVSFSENEILPSACNWVYPTLGFKQYNKQDTEKAMNHLKKCLTKLNNDLLTKTFLVGEKVTLADITLCTNLVMLYVQVLDPKFRESYANVNRWFITCVNQPNFKKILGDVKLCEKMATFDNKRYQEIHPKKAAKDTKPKKEPKKKEPAAAAVAPPAPKPQKIDYFADAPKSDFVMELWKKYYMNHTTEEGQAYLQENFDPNGFSFWHMDYIMDDDTKTDCKQSFKAENLGVGFLQRIEGLIKNCHAVMATFKEQEPFDYYSVAALFMFKGQKNVLKLNPDWNVDAAYGKFTQLDFTDVADKKLIYNFYECIDGAGRSAEWFKFFG